MRTIENEELTQSNRGRPEQRIGEMDAIQYGEIGDDISKGGKRGDVIC